MSGKEIFPRSVFYRIILYVRIFTTAEERDFGDYAKAFQESERFYFARACRGFYLFVYLIGLKSFDLIKDEFIFE